MSEASFFEHFKQQNFVKAASEFGNLDETQQHAILKQLYYQAREANTPVALSVLYRKLNPEKQFSDFYQAWLPPQECTKPFTVGDKTYQHFFPVPLRVINAVNMQDPQDIISVGMVWCTEKEFLEGIKQTEKTAGNAQRADNISEIAEHVSMKFYRVKADDNLGT